MNYALLSNITSNPAFWTFLAATVAPAFVFVTWLMSREHDDGIEESAAMSEAVVAITDANVNITGIVNSLLAPVQAELKRQGEAERRTAEELDIVRAELATLQTRFTSIIRYVNILRRQVRDSGLEPHPIPEDLDLSGFNFD